jgi:hypothetical protein
MLHFLCGAVAAQRLEVAMEYERRYLLARTSGETTARSPVFSAVPSKCTIMDLDFEIFDSERLITEVEKRPTLYN